MTTEQEALTVPMKITFDEALIIDYTLQNAFLRPITWLNIGTVICSGEVLEIDFDWVELWNLRQFMNFSLGLGMQNNVGLELMKKIYTALHSMEYLRELHVNAFETPESLAHNKKGDWLKEHRAENYDEEHKERQKYGGDFDDPYQDGLPTG